MASGCASTSHETTHRPSSMLTAAPTCAEAHLCSSSWRQRRQGIALTSRSPLNVTRPSTCARGRSAPRRTRRSSVPKERRPCAIPSRRAPTYKGWTRPAIRSRPARAPSTHALLRASSNASRATTRATTRRLRSPCRRRLFSSPSPLPPIPLHILIIPSFPASPPSLRRVPFLFQRCRFKCRPSHLV